MIEFTIETLMQMTLAFIFCTIFIVYDPTASWWALALLFSAGWICGEFNGLNKCRYFKNDNS